MGEQKALLSSRTPVPVVEDYDSDWVPASPSTASPPTGPRTGCRTFPQLLKKQEQNEMGTYPSHLLKSGKSN